MTTKNSIGGLKMLAEKITVGGELVITIPLSISLSNRGGEFRLEVEIYVQPALASIKCNCCKKSTRDILGALGILLPEDDLNVDVLSEAEKVFGNTSVFSATHVSLITDVAVIEMYKKHSEINISDSMMAFCAERALQEFLNGKMICDGCLTREFIEREIKNF